VVHQCRCRRWPLALARHLQADAPAQLDHQAEADDASQGAAHETNLQVEAVRQGVPKEGVDTVGVHLDQVA